MLVTGALVIGLVVAGLAVVEANTGPFDHRVQPAAFPVQLNGTYIVEDSYASSPVCSSPASDATCDPTTRVELSVEGLPRLAGAGYAAFLVDGDRQEPLGPLDPADPGHELSYEGDVDGDTFEHLHLSLVDPNGEHALALQAQLLPTSGGDAMPLDDTFDVQLGSADGNVSLAQIGAVEVAVTAKGTIAGLPTAEGWTPVAWLVDEDLHRWTSLGELAPDGETHRIDARMERVTLVEQERFVVTLEPAEGETQQRPAGFPLAQTAVEADALLD